MAALLSSLGAIVVLIAYGAHQLHWMDSDRVPYNLLNFVGGALLAYVALRPFQIGFVIMEGSWTIISAYGLARSLSAARRRSRPGGAPRPPA